MYSIRRKKPKPNLHLTTRHWTNIFFTYFQVPRQRLAPTLLPQERPLLREDKEPEGGQMSHQTRPKRELQPADGSCEVTELPEGRHPHRDVRDDAGRFRHDRRLGLSRCSGEGRSWTFQSQDHGLQWNGQAEMGV